MTSRNLRSSLLAAALIIVPAAAYASDATKASDGTESKATQADQKASGAMQKGSAAMPAKPSAKTTGSGMSAPAQDAEKKARDDNKDYGKPDKH